MLTTTRVSGQRDVSLVIQSGDGQLAHTLPDVRELKTGDFNGDGLPDLCYPLGSPGQARTAILRGRPADAWVGLGEWSLGPDADGDRFPDLFQIQDGERMVARSGRTGLRLWTGPKEMFAGPFQLELPTTDAPPNAPLLAVVNRWRPLPAPDSGQTSTRALGAFSPTQGRLLWICTNDVVGTSSTSGSQLGWAFEYPHFEFRDLDGDAHPEILVTSHDTNNRLRFVVVDGHDGHVRWQKPVVDGAMAPDPRPAGPPWADFNRDGRPDLAAILPSTAATGAGARCQVQVFDGPTGRPLWPAPFDLAGDARSLAWPEPTVGDLNGDGIPEVLVVRHGGFESRHDGYRGEVVALDGATGLPRWTWVWKTGFPEIRPPVILQQASGQPPLVAVGIKDRGLPKIIVLDAGGHEIAVHPGTTPGDPQHSAGTAWRASDLDGDGADELIHADGGRILVVDPRTFEPRWTHALAPPAEVFRVLAPAPGSPGKPGTLVVWDGLDVFGLDGGTGECRWRGVAPALPLWGNSGTPLLQVVDRASDRSRPVLSFAGRFGSTASTRLADTVPTRPDGRYRQP